MIRHGEKPGDGANNLSAQGEARAQRLRNVFGKESGFDIGYIIAERPNKGLSYSYYFDSLCGDQLRSTRSLQIECFVLYYQNYLDGSRERPYETVQPLADDLEDFDVKFNTGIEKDDAEGVARAVKAYRGEGNVLICWEHHKLSDIAKAISIKGFAESSGWSGKLQYPDSRFDLIWVALAPYDEITQVLIEDKL
ncbi:uncharacterized protein N7473_005105 [Penicillium subrubescens]|nr:uncharacterized protein N7473_005105 [Penicillium subrubescens]KAJ5895706.1 hypothetical protein N7473_005105 [Penicillium subrubescens]